MARHLFVVLGISTGVSSGKQRRATTFAGGGRFMPHFGFGLVCREEFPLRTSPPEICFFVHAIKAGIFSLLLSRECLDVRQLRALM